MNPLHYILLLIGMTITYKVTYWFYLYKKGFKSMTPLYFLKYMNIYLVIELVSCLLMLFLLDISGMIVISGYLFATYLGIALSEKRYNEVIKEMEETDQKDQHKAIRNDLAMESKWSGLQKSLVHKSMAEIKNMDDLDPHQKAMLLSMKAGIMKAALEEELRRVRENTNK